MTFDQKAMAVNIAQREDSDARRQHVQEIMELQIDIQNLINQKSQELKLMEMMGGSLTASFQENLVILAEIDGDIRKKTNEIEVLKQKGHKRHKQNPMVQSLLHSIESTNSGSFSPIQPPMRSVTTTRSTYQEEARRNAITTVEESSSLGVTSVDEKRSLATSNYCR